MASYRLAVRRDTAANWTSADPILAQGEFGWETDTLLLKVGDGVTAWSSLGYYDPNPALGTGGSLVGDFKYTNSTTGASAGRIGFDNVNPASITQMNISTISLNDFVWTGQADRILPVGANVILLQKNDTTRWVHVQITSTYTDNTTYYTYDVTYLAVGAGGLPSDGKDCIVEIVQPSRATLNDLEDVIITAPATGHQLKYNGTAWVNELEPEAEIHKQYRYDGVLAPNTGTAAIILPEDISQIRVKAYLDIASSSGDVTADIKLDGVTVITTTITAGNTESIGFYTHTAAMTEGQRITIDITGAGTGASTLYLPLQLTRIS